VHDRFRLGVIIYQLLFGGNNPFQGKWTGAGETPDINELICQGLWVNGSTNLIAAVARTIPLEIVHPEVQQCFLRCFNDGHKNPNFRPTARKWLEALKVGNDRLTICGRVDNHYYSRTYGKCYWCDRSTNLGVDIFPGVVKAKPSAAVESTSQTNIFAATNILELVKQKGKIITVVGKVFITRHLIKQNIVFINFGDVSNLVNGYSSFTIVILSEGLKNLSNYRSLTVNQLSNCAGSYIKITGTLELYQKTGRITPQIILKDPNQISLISETEANQLIVGHTNTTNSSSVKQNQSQVSQTPVYKPQSQSVITQPTAISSTTNNSSSVQQPQSQVSQVTQSTNLLNSSRRRFIKILGAGVGCFGFVVVGKSITNLIGMDYTRLRDLLAAGDWKEANAETILLILEVVDAAFGGLRLRRHIDTLPCHDLRAIDQLWLKYSNGRFGFSVQKRIYQSLRETKISKWEYEQAFYEIVGWRQKGQLLGYSNITFDKTAPEGHLPFYSDTSNSPYGLLGCCEHSTKLELLFSHFDTCKL
ncbi:MAG: GUN4 domain-containing protein, partial [Aphanizomenon sp.]